MKKIIFTTILAALLAFSPVAFAALTGPTGGSGLAIPASLCKITAIAWVFCNSADTLGSSTNRVDKAWLDDLDTTTATIGTLTVSSSTSGDLNVGGFLTVDEGATINDTQANSDFTVKSVGNATFMVVDASASSLSIGNSGVADASAIVDISSTTKGVLLPRMTEAQRDAILTPATGLVLINSDTGRINTYGGASWLVTPTISGNNDWTGINTFENTDLHIFDTDGTHDLILKPGSNLTADRTLTLTTGDADRTISLSGNLTTAADFITSGANSLTLTTTGVTDVTLPTTGTLATLAGSEALTNKTYNGNTFTAGTGTLTIGAGKTLTASDSTTLATNAITLGGGEVITFSATNALSLLTTGSTSVTFPTSGTLYGTATGSITSANLLGSLSDETGTDAVVFANTPTLVTPVLGVATATSINKVTITAPTTSATLTLVDGSSLITSGANSITLTSTGATNVTLPTTGTLATLAGAESLTNKTISSSTITSSSIIDAAVFVVANADNTKRFNFDVSGNTTNITGVLATTFTTAKTLTFPDATDTLVGKATTDTLTNKTLTAPKFADLGFIADPTGAEYLIFDAATTPVNEITISNAATTADPIIAASGETNVDLVVRSKGTGILKLISGDGGQVTIGDTGYSVGAIEGTTETETQLIQYDSVSVTGSLAVDFTDEGLRDYAVAPQVLITAVYNNDAVTLLQCNPHTITTTGMTIECVTIADGVTAVVNADGSARTITYMLIGAVTP